MAPLLTACAVMLVVAGSPAFCSDAPVPEAVASAETDVATVSGDAAQAGATETLTIKSTSKKPPLICKWDTPLGSRVARRICHRSSDEEQARQETRAAAAVVDEAVTTYPTGG
jgi:hypothetical protein